jgi:[NiFe] hydrogenase assembly HybE family chaperone
VNSALAVEAVGFAPWEGHWLGVMVTPWFMNLMLLPRDPASWQPLAQGDKRKYRFPAGIYDFIGASDPSIGEYQVCSLFSPVLEFEDQATARLVAQLARAALFDPENAEVPEYPNANLSQAQPAAPAATADTDARAAAPAVSKRDFLRGRIAGS